MEDYSYADRHQKTLHSASAILPLVFERIGTPTSAVDIGCGVGTWLSVAQNSGVTEVLGLDGTWVDPSLLVIPRERFRTVDLRDLEPLPNRFGLSISLEVAEHLPSACAGKFVKALTEASDFVLFSAAVPHQGGRNHVNEQWPEYWAAHFAAAGYDVHDFIRRRIWADERIPYWYRQNVLFFSRRERSAEIWRPEDATAAPLPLNVVHPQLFERAARAVDKGKVRLIPRSWKRYWKQKLRGTA